MKRGDIVRIKSKKWYLENKDRNGLLTVWGDCIYSVFTPQMATLCGNKYRISTYYNKVSITLEDIQTKTLLPYRFGTWMLELQPETYVNTREYKKNYKHIKQVTK